MPADVTAPAARGNERWVIAAIVTGQFAPAFLFAGVAVALPAMGRDLTMSAVELGLVETTFLAAGTVFLLPAGRLADVTGRRSLYRWSLLAFALLSLAIACAPAAWLVIVLRCLQGVASAMFSASGPALLVELVPPARRGRVFGAVIAVAYLGLALGPSAAGLCVRHFGWRAVFVSGAVWIVLGAIPAWLWLSPRWTPPGRWTQAGATALLVAGTGAVVGSTAATDRGVALALAAAAAGAFAWFLWTQLRVPSPLLDLRELARNVRLRRALLVQLLLYLNAFCTIFLLSLFLQTTVGLAPFDAGLVLATSAVVMAIVAPFAGRLADRVRPEAVARCGVVAIVASSVLGTLLGTASDTWLGGRAGMLHVGAVLALQGVGFGLFSSPNLAAIMASLPPARSGFASALAGQSRGIGMFAGMAVTGAILAAQYGERPVAADPAQLGPALRLAFTVLVGSSVLAFVASLRRSPDTGAAPAAAARR